MFHCTTFLQAAGVHLLYIMIHVVAYVNHLVNILTNSPLSVGLGVGAEGVVGVDVVIVSLKRCKRASFSIRTLRAAC